MPDILYLGIYNRAWHLLRKKVAASRKQSIPRDMLRQWIYDSLEQAVDEWGREGYGKQETPQTPTVQT